MTSEPGIFLRTGAGMDLLPFLEYESNIPFLMPEKIKNKLLKNSTFITNIIIKIII